MKHLARFLLFAIALTMVCNTASAQRRKRTAAKGLSAADFKPHTKAADSLIGEYRFDEATSLLESDIASAKGLGLPYGNLQKLLDRATLGNNMVEVVEKVTIVDSFVVDVNNVLDAIAIDANCGRLLTAQQTKQLVGTKQSPTGSGYVNNFCDHTIFCQSGKGGIVSLFESDKFGDSWSAPKPLEGLLDSSAVRGYPFLLPDGKTLYFASKDSTSLGGYDIFLTRYDSETKSYLKPQNVGMPFNSPFNDYLMVYDEVNDLGWFVSDRFQPEGKVCVYVFLPTTMRQTYTDLDNNSLLQLAALRNIRMTQKGNDKLVADAKVRLKGASSKKESSDSGNTFSFDVAYGTHYNDIKQFKNEEARKYAQEWTELNEKYNKLISLLKENRKRYEDSPSQAERKAMATIILQQEKEVEVLNEKIYELANMARKAEMQK